MLEHKSFALSFYVHVFSFRIDSIVVVAAAVLSRSSPFRFSPPALFFLYLFISG